MLKFYQDNNPPLVWDGRRNKLGVQFRNGVFETEDQSAIDLLLRVGYRHDPIVEPIVKDIAEEDDSNSNSNAVPAVKKTGSEQGECIDPPPVKTPRKKAGITRKPSANKSPVMRRKK